MKKIFCLAAAIVTLMFTGCKDYDSDITEINDRLDGIENTKIATIQSQIGAINTSLPKLENTNKELGAYITALQNSTSKLNEDIATVNRQIAELKQSPESNNTKIDSALVLIEQVKSDIQSELFAINTLVENLQNKDTELNGKVNDLQKYVDDELSEMEDWSLATFGTLEKQNTLISDVVLIKEQIIAINDNISKLESRVNEKITTDIASAVATLNTTIQGKVQEITTNYTAALATAKEDITSAYTSAISDAISSLENSMKSWVNEQLKGYYTIAEIDSKLSVLRTFVTDEDEKLQGEISDLTEALANARNELTTAYTNAIKAAIEENNGIINNKIANEIATVDKRITNEINTINNRLDYIESRLDGLEDKVDDLMNRKLEITFDDTENIAILAGGFCKINYTITSSESEIHIATIAQNGWKASVTKSTEKTGYITVYAPNPLTTEPIIILVSDANTTIMRSLSFIDGVTNIATKSYAVTNEATTLSVNVSTNLNYTVSIPSSASSWISLKNITTRAAMRNDVINLDIKENTETSSRTATLQLVCNDTEIGTISIYQQGIEVANNELVYTSSNGKIIEPYQTMGFNANILSNTYSNGRGVIVFDKAITAISEYAFYRCSVLTSIKMPKSILQIRDYAFYNCSLESITIGDSVTTIGDYAFYGTGLYNLVIPNSVTTIGDYAFAESSLRSVTIGNSVTTIGDYAFDDCTGLTNITIPNSVISIGGHAFCDCTGLTSVTIPNSVTSIGGYAFQYCKGLTSIYIKAINPPSLYYDVFYNINSSAKIYVPMKSVVTYTSSDGWRKYADKIVGYNFNE